MMAGYAGMQANPFMKINLDPIPSDALRAKARVVQPAPMILSEKEMQGTQIPSPLGGFKSKTDAALPYRAGSEWFRIVNVQLRRRSTPSSLQQSRCCSSRK